MKKKKKRDISYQREWAKRNPDKIKIYRQNFKERHRVLSARWNKENPEKRKRVELKFRLKKSYGMDISEWDMLFEQQGGKCAACGSLESGHQFWNLDHDHESGKPRGILCNNCNSALGMVGDSKERLLLLVSYLERSANT